MRESYPFFEEQEVKPEWVLDPEEMGSKIKFWYRRPGEQEDNWLFKYPRANTGEHWAEKISAKVVELLEISHARVELAAFEGERGSVTESFARGGQELVHGNQMLAGVVHGYDPKRKFSQSSHTLENIWKVIDTVFVKSEAQTRGKLCIAEYLVLDALIGNTDRHHENWGILRERSEDGWVGFVAPSFDHASSLGRELQDERRDRLLAENRVGDYAEKGRGAIYWSEDERNGPSPLELIRRATHRYPDLFHPALAMLERLDERPMSNLVDRVPDHWMSPSARKFTTVLMRYNFERLGGLI